MTSVMVTGPSGFVASHLIRRILVRTDWSVVAVGRTPPPVDTGVRFVCGDLRATDELPVVDTVFSLAANVDVAVSLETPTAVTLNNVGIACGLVDYGRRTGARIVHVTTAEVFGPGGPHDVVEPARPTNPYAASKAAQDAIFHSAVMSFGVDVISARTANVFGESQPVTKFVPTVIRNLLAGDPVRLFGDARRRWIHADDVADTLIGITGDVNVTGADLLDNRQIVERIASRLGIVPKIEVVAAGRPGHEGVYDLAPSPGMTDDLDAGLDRVVAWFAR